jgi:starch synthase
LRILFMAAEAAPFAKVGGLGDVAGALPRALAALGHEVWLLIPRHPVVARATGAAAPAVPSFWADFDWKPRHVELLTMPLAERLTLALLVSPDYFDRPALYTEPDDIARYVFFSRIGLAAVERAGWRPDVLHAHDWHAAGAVNWLVVTGRHTPFWATTGSVLTIHNLAYQGWTTPATIGLLGVEWGGLLGVEWQRFHGQVNLLARGLSYADMITAVSPTYTREILTPEYGAGLDDVLRSRAHRLRGILNGIDRVAYDPATDRRLAATFDVGHLAARAANTRQLRAFFDLPERDVPLIGIVSRLTYQKGFDLIAAALDQLVALDVQIAVLGAGEARYHELWQSAARRYPSQIGVRFGFDEPVAQLVYGGSDLFLMPSLFEPGGLGQLLAMRYGSVPIVRATGGLADTVVDADASPNAGTGFVFGPATADALLAAVDRAVIAFRRPARWRAIVRRAMSQEFSWERSARDYEEVYEISRQAHRAPVPAASQR